tara:strand:- start:419 stop:727 length:309 start_codon:yes stop_codon:yes gene_type:complete
MKKLIIILAIGLHLQVNAQSVPHVIQDLKYSQKELITDEGEAFNVFYVKNNDYNTLKSRIKKLKVVERDRDGSLLFVTRVDTIFEYVSMRSFKLKQIAIYEK